MKLQPGDILEGRYRIDELLGQGGMGAIYKATDIRLAKICAIKQTTLNIPDAARLFEREARLLAGLDHVNLPHVSDHFIAPQGQFLVMQYIPGAVLNSF